MLSPDDCWSSQGDMVRIEADVVDRDGGIGLSAQAEDLHKLREFLPRLTKLRQVVAACAQHAHLLIENPEWGVRLMWVGIVGGSEKELDFDVGPKFVDSVKEMNYRTKPGLSAACLRAMALIAGGRSDEVDGHETREKGPGSQILRVDGNAVMRSRLENKRPDANRLHWIKGSRPKFLNVSGHEAGPAL